jgi:hypothetical protein
MGQLGFFDLSRRYEGLDVKDNPLVAIAAMIPWEQAGFGRATWRARVRPGASHGMKW